VHREAQVLWSPRNSNETGPTSRKRRCWDGFSAELINIAQPLELAYRVEEQTAFIALHDVVKADGETTIDGFGRSTLCDLRNKITFLPNGCRLEGWSKYKRRPSSALAVHLNPGVEELHDSRLSKLPPSLFFESKALSATMIKIAAVADGLLIDEHSYVESLGCLLLYELQHELLNGLQRNQIQGGLTPRQVNRIKEYVDANISQKISLAELAGLVGFSRYHFIRAFKKSTNVAPYQFVIARRVECAKDLLLQEKLSVANVATSVGFASSLQLNRAFRRLLGVTPSIFRRDAGRSL